VAYLKAVINCGRDAAYLAGTPAQAEVHPQTIDSIGRSRF